MSVKRTTYKGLSFPEDDTYLNVRPAFTRMCMENRVASKLLSALIFKWEPGADIDLEKVNTFRIQLTQAEIIRAMCDEATSKTIHDAAMPCLHLFGYADVDETTYPFTYTVHMDRVREGLSYCKQGPKQLEKVLIVWAEEKGLSKPDGKVLNKKNLYFALEKVLILIRESSNSIGNCSNSEGKSSNSRRGPKPKRQAVSQIENEDPKNYKHSKNLEEQVREDDATANADCDYSSFLSELALSEIRMDAMLDTIVNSPPPVKTEPVEKEPPQEPVQTPPQKPNIRIVPIATGTTNTPPPTNGKGNRGRRQSVQLTLQGQHIHEVYQTFKERKIALTESTIKAANGLGEVVEDDAVFLKVLEAIRDNAFLKERKVGTDLDFVYRKYDSYVDIVKRPEEPQKTGSSQKTPPSEKKPLTPEQQTRLNELLAKRRAESAQPVEMRA